MVDNRGNATSYSNHSGFIVPKLADDVIYRKAHDPRPPKPTGLDWDALTPTCSGCSQKSGQIDGTGLCPSCRGDKAVNPIQANVTTTGRGTYQELDDHDVAHRFTAPTQTPQAAEPAPTPRTVVEPEATTPAVAAAAPPRPADPTVRAKVRRVSNHDVVIVLHSTTDAALDPVAVAALLSDLLHQLNPQTPAAATSTAAAGPKSEGRTRVGKPARSSDTPRTRRVMGTQPTRARGAYGTFPLAEARRLYLDEQWTVTQIAKHLRRGQSTVRNQLKDAGITMRDDRATHSGGRNKRDYDPALVEQVQRLYVDQHLTIAQVAEQLDSTPKVIGTLMARNNIPARPDAFTSEGHPRRDNAGALKARIAELGVTSHQIKTWAHEHGHITAEDRSKPGVPSRWVVDAYATAHPERKAS